jgi:kynurenine formamidase
MSIVHRSRRPFDDVDCDLVDGRVASLNLDNRRLRMRKRREYDAESGDRQKPFQNFHLAPHRKFLTTFEVHELLQSANILCWRAFANIKGKCDRGKMLIELGQTTQTGSEKTFRPPNSLLANLRGMVFESVGPMRHEVSVPFHDSQVRGAALLIQTGWDQRWGTDAYWEPGPFLADHLIFRAVRAGSRLLGVDFPVTEKSSETQLITSGKIAIVENLKDLARLPRLGFRFTVEPLEGSSGEIRVVRAYAEW